MTSHHSRIPADVDVVIIGAGPVGLTTSLLLSRYRVPHVVVEQRGEPPVHPQAHFISCRSMEIFRGLDGLDRTIRSASAPLDEWRHYVYCTDLAHLPKLPAENGTEKNALLGLVDHFPDGPDHNASPTWECNLPQHVLVGLLRKAALLQDYGRLLEGFYAEVNEDAEGPRVVVTKVNSGRRRPIRCRYVVCADGARSACRNELGIRRRKKTPVLQHLLNVHFISPELADLLREGITGMLYFVYTPRGIGVFVNHSLKAGEFVLQLPFFPPHQNTDAYTPAVCAEIIDQLAGIPVQARVKSVRPWRLSAWVAENFSSRSGRCFLVGDAAHQVLPAGGFGLNCGLGDAHNLAWKLAMALRLGAVGDAETVQHLLDSYDTERRPVAERYLDLSKRNFKKPLAVSSAIGLDWQAARWMDRLVRLTPAPDFLRRGIFDLGMRIGLSQVKLLDSDNLVGNIRRREVNKIFADPAGTLQMRFPRQDLGVVYQRGWLEGAVDTDFYRTRSTRYDPDLIVGARLPHFWLTPINGKNTDRISSIDLYGIASETSEGPVHLVLLFDMTPESVQQVMDELPSRFTPVTPIYIQSAEVKTNNPDYALSEMPPPYLPLHGAVLTRPDGHIAAVVHRPVA